MQWTPKRCERRKIDELKKNGGETPGLKVHVQREQVVKNGDVDAIWTPIGMDVWWSLQGSATKQGDDSGFANEVVMLFLIVTIALPFTSQGSVWCYPMLHASYLVAGDIPMLLVVVCILHHPTENGGPIPRHVRIGETKPSGFGNYKVNSASIYLCKRGGIVQEFNLCFSSHKLESGILRKTIIKIRNE